MKHYVSSRCFKIRKFKKLDILDSLKLTFLHKNKIHESLCTYFRFVEKNIMFPPLDHKNLLFPPSQLNLRTTGIKAKLWHKDLLSLKVDKNISFVNISFWCLYGPHQNKSGSS